MPRRRAAAAQSELTPWKLFISALANSTVELPNGQRRPVGAKSQYAMVRLEIDRTGSLEYQNLYDFNAQSGIGLDEETLRGMIDEVARESQGAISEDEFRVLWQQYVSGDDDPTGEDPWATLVRALSEALEGEEPLVEAAFRASDEDCTGRVSFRNLRTVLTRFGIGNSETPVRMMEQADDDGDGELSLEEWRVAWATAVRQIDEAP